MIRTGLWTLVLAMGMAVAMTVGVVGNAWAAGGVMVFGGSGRTGAEIAKLLLAKGEEVTVFVRPTSDRKRLDGLKVNYAVGDAMTAADVDAAIAKAKPRVVINTIGGRGTTKNYWDTTQKNMTAAAKKHGATEIIFHSSVGVGDSAVAYSEAARARTKEVMDERFIAEEDMKASGLTYVIIRTGIIAPESMAMTGQARLTEDRTAMGPVTRADLAKLTVDCIGNAACRNKTFAAIDDTVKMPPREQR